MKVNFLVLSFLSVITIIITWPLIFNLNSLTIDPHDGLLITWILNWQVHSLTQGLGGILNYYNANIFFPYSGTLAFSETIAPQALISLPFVTFFQEPLLAYNVNFLFGFIGTGYATYLLVRQVTQKYLPALLAANIFTFSIIHLNYMAHLQLFNFWPVIFAILFIFQKRYLLFIFFFLLASLTTALNFYFLLLIVVLYLIILNVDSRKLIICTFFAVFLTVPFLLPYYLVSRQFSYVRPITDSIHFSLQLPDLLNISQVSRFHHLSLIHEGTPAFLGIAFIFLLIGMTISRLRKKYSLTRNRPLVYFLALAAISFILTLGPGLHVFRNTIHVGPLPMIPLPYLLFYYLVPGFSGFRTPSRWILLTALALCLAISIYFSKKLSKKAVALILFLLIIEIKFPFAYSRVPSVSEFPPEQIWLKNNQIGEPIILFPIYNWDNQPGFGQETLREYFSTIHFHPMFNGYSGFSPSSWEAKVRWLQKEFPSYESMTYLRSIGIKLILAPRSWEAKMRQRFTHSESESKMTPDIQLKLIKSFPQTNIYEII